MTFLDNCWDYNDGESEVAHGQSAARWLSEKVFLMTKIDGRTKETAASRSTNH